MPKRNRKGQFVKKAKRKAPKRRAAPRTNSGRRRRRSSGAPRVFVVESASGRELAVSRTKKGAARVGKQLANRMRQSVQVKGKSATRRHRNALGF